MSEYSSISCLTTGCSGNPCHRGTCIPMNNQYFCLCSPGYVGHNCDKDTDDCANSPCEYGTCKDMVDDFYCECVVFSKGKMCSKFTSWAIAFICSTFCILLLLQVPFWNRLRKKESRTTEKNVYTIPSRKTTTNGKTTPNRKTTKL
ncbi:fibropellin-1-like [Mytilus trossulus]|uniref:fibropellin-1-like n=1 Tax=Mytilus trossulus TaxID=6551 RepID=UPI0030066338